MKKAMTLLLILTLLLGMCPASLAQGYVSVSELHDQAQAMGGRWQKRYDTPSGAVEVDVPILVPDVERMPVITVERAAPFSDELFAAVMQGRRTEEDKKQGSMTFEIDLDGRAQEFFFGYESDGQDQHDALTYVWIQRGGYRFGTGTGAMGEAKPDTYHYPWEVAPDQPLARGSEQTIDDVMAIWREDIALCYPDGAYEIQPKHIVIHGSTLAENKGKDKASKRNGYYTIQAEQVIGGVPLFGAIASNDGENNYGVNHTSTPETNRISDRLNPYRVGALGRQNYLKAFSSNAGDNRTLTELDRLRTVEIADVPLAPLDSVLASLEAEITAGHIRRVFSLRLGYLLYSNPEMTDYAVAVPRWVAECHYITKSNQASVERFHAHDDGWMNQWNAWEYVQMPVDAQSGELILFTTGDEATFRVPEIATWDKVK